jgi:hypothetical protein
MVLRVGVRILGAGGVVLYRSRRTSGPCPLSVKPRAASCVLASFAHGRPMDSATGDAIFAGPHCGNAVQSRGRSAASPAPGPALGAADRGREDRGRRPVSRGRAAVLRGASEKGRFQGTTELRVPGACAGRRSVRAVHTGRMEFRKPVRVTRELPRDLTFFQ